MSAVICLFYMKILLNWIPFKMTSTRVWSTCKSIIKIYSMTVENLWNKQQKESGSMQQKKKIWIFFKISNDEH